MPKKITKDTGMMQRTELEYRMDDPVEVEACIAAFMEWSETTPVAQPGELPGFALYRANAERMRAILETVGMDDGAQVVPDTNCLRALGLAENSAQWIAAHWLAEYNRLLRGCEQFNAGELTADNLARLLMATEEMGRLQERLWWRAGIDPESGERREALALTGRPVKQGQKEAARQTNARHAKLRERRFARMRELVPPMKVENAARHCEAEGLGSWQAIERQWNRWQEKSDT